MAAVAAALIAAFASGYAAWSTARQRRENSSQHGASLDQLRVLTEGQHQLRADVAEVRADVAEVRIVVADMQSRSSNLGA